MILVYPEHVVELAKRSKRHELAQPYDDSPSLAREVLADWLEERGDHLAKFLRPRPLGEDEEQWNRNRLWLLNAIIEADSKRDALSELIGRGSDDGS